MAGGRSGNYGAPAVPSADYLAVADDDITRIESPRTVAGGKVVHSAGDYEHIAAPLPAHQPRLESRGPLRRFLRAC
ncbi:hypothetical protein [Streptomyces sp. NPDC048385]|uniref:hypothetical protein n=1 Tax=unclassified Streptomyces TaxID=2593676 RepID=UPI003415220A